MWIYQVDSPAAKIGAGPTSLRSVGTNTLAIRWRTVDRVHPPDAIDPGECQAGGVFGATIPARHLARSFTSSHQYTSLVYLSHVVTSPI